MAAGVLAAAGFFTGVGPVVAFLTVEVVGFAAAGAVVLGVVFFTATGRGFFVPMGVRAGLEASLTVVFADVTGVFFTGAVEEAGLVADPVGSAFLVPMGVRTGVALAGVAVFAGVELDAGVPVELSFRGTFFTGVVEVFVVLVVAAAGFLTGVLFTGVAFVVVDCATLETLSKFD